MDIYKENILYHSRYPKNYGRLKDKTHSIRINNPLCGDQIEIELKIKKGIIKKIGFVAEGCIISRASSSMFLEFIKGKTLKELGQISQDQVIKLLGVKLGVNRMKCALLPFLAIRDILKANVKKNNQ